MSNLALVYRGKASTDGCPEAAARILRLAGFDVAYAGKGEEFKLDARSLAQAAVYAQPGGDELEPAWRHMRKHADVITDFVSGGGRYLGFCLGAYLAGHTPGLGLLDGDAMQYIATPGAEIATESAAVLEVMWAGHPRRVYFQDGCTFETGPTTDVVARYTNGAPAAVINDYGRGRVAAVGPHPEATDDWFIDDDLPVATPGTDDLALDIVRRLVA
ncbi:BPL-N domain-containing protein [Nigerium massiliense]|uniref:BPL-N domain-containing protein n=1 Tax=Nigerium massiliense TaxID=1522317 RepID=UPI00058CCBD1|nr:BPL-N domain-containing protein [Nigerium massiliense]